MTDRKSNVAKHTTELEMSGGEQGSRVVRPELAAHEWQKHPPPPPQKVRQHADEADAESKSNEEN